MEPLQLLRSAGRRFVVVLCRDHNVPLVYVIQRVASPEFLRLATAALAVAQVAQQDAYELDGQLLGAKTDADRERVTAELAAAAKERAAQSVAKLASDPASLVELQAQADRLVQAAVVAVGIGLPDTPLGLQPIGTKAAQICEPVGATSEGTEPVYLRPVRWMATAQPDADGMWIGELREAERMELSSLIWEAFSPAKAVESFRPGAAGDRGSVGAPVRPKAERAAPVRRPARGGAGPRGDGGG